VHGESHDHTFSSVKKRKLKANEEFTESKSMKDGLVYRIIKNVYAPFLFKLPVRICVLVFFFGWLCSSIAVLHKIDVGLEQELAMPEDSHVLTYLK